jgi:hypothetical protein
LRGGFDCRYLIQVTNTGPGVYNDGIEIDDQLSAIPAGWIPSPGWDCPAAAGVDMLHCTHPPVVLNPGESVFLEMWANVPDDFRECQLDNQVRITHAPRGSDQNTDPGDDVASASAQIPSPHCVGERTNLRIRKTAIDPVCSVSEGRDGWLCKFAIQVRNTGPATYSGTLEVEDLLPPLPAGSVVRLTTFDAGCTYDGPALPAHTCAWPVVTLGPGGWTAVLVDVFVPASHTSCELTNTARITVALVAARKTASPATTRPRSPCCSTPWQSSPVVTACWMS